MSERLEIIKFLRNSEKTVAPGMQPSELISRKDVEWLINRVEELEQELELEKSTNKDFEAHLLKQVESAKVQNERYKRALELIYKDTFYESEHDLVSPIHVIRKRAEKALEGDDD